MTPQQQAAIDKLRPDAPVAWLVIYEDGESTIIRDDARSHQHAAGAHGIRIPLVPQLEPKP